MKIDKSEIEGNFSTKLIVLCGLCIFLVSLVIHQKNFYNMNAYGTTQPIANASNLFSYYKMVLMGCLSAGMVAVLIYRRFVFKSEWRLDYMTLSCGMIVLGAFISILYNPVGYMLWVGFFMRTNGFFAYLFLYSFLFVLSSFTVKSKSIIWTIRIVTAFTVLATLIGLFQFFGMDIYNTAFIRKLMLPGYLDVGALKNTKIADAAFSLFSHYNYYSGFCAIFFPLMISLAIETKVWKEKIAYYIAVLLLSLGVVTSISQSGVFTLMVVSALVIFFLGEKDTWKELIVILCVCTVMGILLAMISKVQTYQELAPRLKIWLVSPIHIIEIVGIVALIIIATCLKSYMLENSRKTMSVLIVLFVTSLIIIQGYLICVVAKDHTHMFTDRGYVWTNTYELLKENPIIGYGPDNFYYAFPQNNPDAKNYSGGNAYDKPHNMLLQMYMDTGVIGVMGFLILLVGMMLSIVNNEYFYEKNREGAFLRGVLLLIMAYMVQGVVNDNHITIQPMLFFTLAVCMGLTRKVRLNKTKSK